MYPQSTEKKKCLGDQARGQVEAGGRGSGDLTVAVTGTELSQRAVRDLLRSNGKSLRDGNSDGRASPMPLFLFRNLFCFVLPHRQKRVGCCIQMLSKHN